MIKSRTFVEPKRSIKTYWGGGGGGPPMGGRVIFKPEVFVLGFRESIGFPFFPLPSVGFRVVLSPEGGRVKPLPDDKGLALIGGGEGGDGGKDGASSGSLLSTES